jgi:hypothetical protein
MSSDPYLLWTARDHENDVGELRRAAPADPVFADADVLGVLRVNGSGFLLDTDTARGLRDALNVLLVDDAGVDVEPMVMHEAQHHAVQRQALRIGRDVAEQAADLVRLASKARGLDAPATTGADTRALAELVRMVTVQQSRTTSLLGDLAAVIGGAA